MNTISLFFEQYNRVPNGEDFSTGDSQRIISINDTAS